MSGFPFKQDTWRKIFDCSFYMTSSQQTVFRDRSGHENHAVRTMPTSMHQDSYLKVLGDMHINAFPNIDILQTATCYKVEAEYYPFSNAPYFCSFGRSPIGNMFLSRERFYISDGTQNDSIWYTLSYDARWHTFKAILAQEQCYFYSDGKLIKQGVINPSISIKQTIDEIQIAHKDSAKGYVALRDFKISIL